MAGRDILIDVLLIQRVAVAVMIPARERAGRRTLLRSV